MIQQKSDIVNSKGAILTIEMRLALDDRNALKMICAKEPKISMSQHKKLQLSIVFKITLATKEFDLSYKFNRLVTHMLTGTYKRSRVNACRNLLQDQRK
ncbi:hypothetical protein NPIL_406831 [Nephila pilipes]|uniref:Uncharacterized protein n=1 Tax=Nephila pilipes TaxID=299642 RepID=A0A8X6NBI6_NEPPI|nr:hypothetical protein NPIL_406831 [Nephila pilipes]